MWLILASRRVSLPAGTLIPGGEPRFSEDGRLLLSGFNLPRVTDLTSGQQTEIPGLAVSLSIQAGAEFFSSDEIVSKHPPAVYSIESRSVRASTTNLWSEDASLVSVPHSQNLLTFSGSDGARFWTRTDRPELFSAGAEVQVGKVNCAAFSPAGTYLTLCADGRTEVFTGDGASRVGTIDMPAASVAFLDDSTMAIGVRPARCPPTCSPHPVWTSSGRAPKPLLVSSNFRRLGEWRPRVAR